MIFDEVFRALFYLLISGIVCFAWKQSYDSAKRNQLKSVLWKGFLWCGGIALFASLTLGNPTCEIVEDPVRGGCAQYADNAFEPTAKKRIANFAYFMTLLYLPVAIGAFNGSKKQV